MIDYEVALVCACLQEPDAFYKAKELRLSPESFQNEDCRAVFDCMVRNQVEGIPHTPVEIWMRVKREYPKEATVIESCLSLSKAEVGDIDEYPRWAQHIAEQSRDREQDAAFAEIFQRVKAGEDKLSAAQEIIERFASIEDSYTIEENRIERQREAVRERLRNRIVEGLGLVSTGIHQMDRDLGRLEDYEYTVLAARPGRGKSALARQIATEFIRTHKQPVQLFSMEMGVDQVVKFMAATNCNISAKGIEDAFEPQKERFMEECDRFTEALGRYLFVHDDCSTFDDVEHHILSGIRRHKPGLIIIDYLQLLSPRVTQGMNREQQIAHMSRRLKNITTIHRIPVIVLSQMSREYEKEEREPRKSDLRESGSLEQDADRIWFLHHDVKDDMIGGNLPMHLIQAKGRSTGEGRMRVHFKLNTTKFLFDWEEPTPQSY
jgi:replicative DNA helicase